MADAIAEWRLKLKPWLSVLRTVRLRADLPPLPTVSDINEMWLSIDAPQHILEPAETWMMVAEALELLELLARVRHRAAWKLLFEVAREERVIEQYGDYLFASPDLLPRFLIQVEDEGLLEAGQPTLFGLLRFVVKASVVSDDYNEVKQMLLSQYADNHDDVAFDRDVHGRVKVALSFDVSMDYDNESAIQCVFKQIGDLVTSSNDPSCVLPGMGPDREASDSEEDDAEEDETVDGKTNASTGEVAEGSASDEGEGIETRSATRHRERAPFQLDSYRMLLSSSDIVPNLVIFLMNEAYQSGVPLSHFSITNVAQSLLHHSIVGDFFINQIVPWGGRHVQCGIKNLKFHKGMFDAAAVRGFCSAIVCSHTLRTVTFDQSFGETDNPHGDIAGLDVWWPWLAYALFSRDATHQIHSVQLDLHGLRNMAIVNAVRDVLGSDDPAKRLYRPEESASTHEVDALSPPMAAVLKETATLRLGSYGARINAHTLTIGEPGVSYRVLRDVPEEEFIEFLLPGSGVAWTERSELVELKPLPRRTVHTIRHLTLKAVGQEELHTAIALLELIGEPLERVSIIDTSADEAFFEAVLTCCPNLKRLDIKDTVFQSFDWLCRPKSAHFPKLETLTINYYTVRAPLDWSLLFDSLSDATHPLSESLRELSITSNAVHDDTTQDAQDEIVRQYTDMLGRNARLTRCEMTTHLKPTFDKYKAQFHTHHLEFIAAKEAPLPMPQTLAFLSAATPTMETKDQQSSTEPIAKRSKRLSGSTTALAVCKLSPEALRLVLEFAAIAKRRLCKMEHHLSFTERFIAEESDTESDDGSAVGDGEEADDV